MTPTINQQEAGAFYTHAAILGLSTADALRELAATTWPDLAEDAAFGRRRHTPTIRRLARPLLAGLDAQHAAAQTYNAARAADVERWAELAAETREEIRAHIRADRYTAARRRARDAGLTVLASDILRLGDLAFPDGAFARLHGANCAARGPRRPA